MRTAVTTSALPRAVGQQCAVTQPPALPIEGAASWVSRIPHLSQLHPCSSPTALWKPAAPNLEGTATALILDILGKGMAKIGKGLF